MTITAVTRPAPTGTPARTGRSRRLLVGMLLTMIVCGTVLFAQLGCERMRAAEPLGEADATGRIVTGYGWSLRPLGFTVRYVDGPASTRLWW